MKIKQKVLVTAIIIKNNKVLLQRRLDDVKTHNGKWTTPSGIVEINEHPAEAIIREVKEELNLKIKIEQMVPVIDSFPNHKDRYHLIYISFLCKILEGEATNIDEDNDISEIGWFDINNLDKIETIRGTKPPIEASKKILQERPLS